MYCAATVIMMLLAQSGDRGEVCVVIEVAVSLTLFHSCARCGGRGESREQPISNLEQLVKDLTTHIRVSNEVTHPRLMALAITSRSWLSKRLTLGTSRMRR